MLGGNRMNVVLIALRASYHETVSSSVAQTADCLATICNLQ